MRSDDWTEPQEKTLRELIAGKHTSTEAAERLGRSRSAVAGKARRMGLSFDGRDDDTGRGFGKIRANINKEAHRRGITVVRMRKELMSMGAEVYREEYKDSGSLL